MRTLESVHVRKHSEAHFVKLNVPLVLMVTFARGLEFAGNMDATVIRVTLEVFVSLSALEELRHLAMNAELVCSAEFVSALQDTQGLIADSFALVGLKMSAARKASAKLTEHANVSTIIRMGILWVLHATSAKMGTLVRIV